MPDTSAESTNGPELEAVPLLRIWNTLRVAVVVVAISSMSPPAVGSTWKATFVVEPMVKAGIAPPFALIEREESGEVVPMPTFPLTAKVVEAITEVEEAKNPDSNHIGEVVAEVVVLKTEM